MLKKQNLKKITYTSILAASIGFSSILGLTAYAGEQDIERSDGVIIGVSNPDNPFFSITLDMPEPEITEDGVRMGNIHFENVNNYALDGQRLHPVGGSTFELGVIVESFLDFTLAVEGNDFIDPSNPENIVPITHLRTRVASRDFDNIRLTPATATANTTQATADARVTTLNTVGILRTDLASTNIRWTRTGSGTIAGNNWNVANIAFGTHQFHSVTTEPSPLVRNTTARGYEIRYNMRFDFLADSSIDSGQLETTIRYIAWQY